MDPSTGEAKRHPLLGDLAFVRQREHLEAAGIGEDRPLPANEPMQPAEFTNDIQARSQEQVKGVAQDDLGTYLDEVARGHGLHRAVGAHGHKRGGFHRSAVEGKAAAARCAVGGEKIEMHGSHLPIIACWWLLRSGLYGPTA